MSGKFRSYLKIYKTVIILLGFLALLGIFYFPPTSYTPAEVVFFIFLVWLFSLFDFPLPSGGYLTLNFPIIMASLFLYGPQVAVLVLIPNQIFSGLRRKQPERILFNIAQKSISIFLASHFFLLFGDFTDTISLNQHFLGMIAVLLAYDLLSIAQVCAGLTLWGRGKFRQLFVGTFFHVRLKIIPLYYSSGIIFTLIFQQEGFLGAILTVFPLISIFFILSDQKLIQKTKEKALIDPLTGLYNRRYLDEWMENNFSLIKEKNRELSLLMVDIDNFKDVNDIFGHQTGDEILKEVADTLKNSLREKDLLIRFGGEEFLIILSDTPPEMGQKIGERIRKSVQKIDPPSHRDGPSQITVSLGLASLKKQYEDRKTPEDLLRQADNACYLAKFQGKNRLCIHWR